MKKDILRALFEEFGVDGWEGGVQLALFEGGLVAISLNDNGFYVWDEGCSPGKWPLLEINNCFEVSIRGSPCIFPLGESRESFKEVFPSSCSPEVRKVILDILGRADELVREVERRREVR